MIVELGHFALVLALMVAVVQATLPLWGAQTRNPALMPWPRRRRWRNSCWWRFPLRC